MTEDEIKEWLGFPARTSRHVRPEILAAMAGVPRPPDGPTDEHLGVFAAFLRGGAGLTDRRIVFTPNDKPTEDGGQRWGDKGCAYRPDKCTHEDPDDGCEWCCMTCNADRHLCPGCGTVTDHRNTVCSDCRRLL